MSLPDNPPLSIVDLNDDCLFQIFPHLHLSDLLNFRLTCSRLNDAVCKYFPQITELSIVYTEHGPDGVPSKKLPEYANNTGDSYFYSDWLDRDVTDFTRKFTWKNNLIVIFGRVKFQTFLEFIAKHKIENIKKLSLIVDSDPNQIVTLPPATELLKICPKVETLFLEQADRHVIVDPRSANQPVFKAEDLGGFFDTIIGLVSLSELHFFTSLSHIYGAFLTPDDTMELSKIPDDQVKQMFANFLLTMFQKLPIFGFNHRGYHRQPVEQSHLAPLLEQSFENILELGFGDTDFMKLVNSGTTFNNLRSLALFNGGHRFGEFNIRNSFEQLTTLRFGYLLCLTEQALLNLNSLPNLETLSAMSLAHREFVDGHFRRNRTIKHIEVEEVDFQSTDEHVPEYVRPLYPFTHFFQALETVTISPPKADKVVYDRNTLNDLLIGSW